jgi:hypothetical protein
VLLGCFCQAHAWYDDGACQGFYNFTVLGKVLADTGTLAERNEAVIKMLKSVKANPETYANLAQLWGTDVARRTRAGSVDCREAKALIAVVWGQGVFGVVRDDAVVLTPSEVWRQGAKLYLRYHGACHSSRVGQGASVYSTSVATALECALLVGAFGPALRSILTFK